MHELKYTELNELVLYAQPGANIGECMREGALLAMMEWVNVKVIHNGQEYKILCNDVIGCFNKEKGIESVRIPKTELEKLEEERTNLYNYLGNILSDNQMFDVMNVTGQIWKVANKKVWD